MKLSKIKSGLYGAMISYTLFMDWYTKDKDQIIEFYLMFAIVTFILSFLLELFKDEE